MRHKRHQQNIAMPGMCGTCPVRRLALFQPLSEEEVAATQGYRVDTRVVEPGGAVFRQGDSSAEVYTLFDGWAFLSQRTADGGRQILEFLLPGDFFGLQPGRFGDARIHSAHAITPVSLCVFTYSGLMEMFKEHIDLGMRLTWMTARDEAIAHEHLVSLGRRSARERIAHLLLELFHRARSRRRDPEPGSTIDFPLTQEHVADACGLTKIHVSRILSALREDNLLVWRAKELTIPNPARLAAVANYSHDLAASRPIL